MLIMPPVSSLQAMIFNICDLFCIKLWSPTIAKFLLQENNVRNLKWFNKSDNFSVVTPIFKDWVPFYSSIDSFLQLFTYL